MNSIINQTKRCYVCGSTSNLHLHHIMFGKNRKNADADGLTCYLCWEHHEGTNGVHGKNGHDLNLKLKKVAQYKWCEHYNKTQDDFIDRYHQWYY